MVALCAGVMVEKSVETLMLETSSINGLGCL